MKTLLLTEIQLKQVIAILVESKKEEFLKNKYNVDDFVIDVAKEIDPTPNNKYMEWLVKQNFGDSWWYAYKKERITDMLELYAKDKIRKSLPKLYQDINGFDSIDIFVIVMREINPADFISKTEAYEQTYRGKAGKYKVYQPTTYIQSCKLGSGTRWCTSADSDRGRRSFKTYTEDDNILLIFIDGDEKYQYASGGEFMDKENEPAAIPKDIALWLVVNGYKEITIEEKLKYNLPLTDEELHIKGSLILMDNKTIKELPDGLRVENSLDISWTNIEKLPDDLYVGGYLRLTFNQTLKELPKGLKVDGNLGLKHTNIEKLPNDLYVGGDLNLYKNKTIKELPNGLRIDGRLILTYTNIDKLPSDLYVEGDLHISHTPLTKYTDDEIRSMVKYIGGKIVRE